MLGSQGREVALDPMSTCHPALLVAFATLISSLPLRIVERFVAVLAKIFIQVQISHIFLFSASPLAETEIASLLSVISSPKLSLEEARVHRKTKLLHAAAKSMRVKRKATTCPNTTNREIKNAQ